MAPPSRRPKRPAAETPPPSTDNLNDDTGPHWNTTVGPHLFKFLTALRAQDFLYSTVKNSRMLFERGYFKNKYNKYIVETLDHMIDKEQSTTQYTFDTPSNAFAYGRAIPGSLHPDLVATATVHSSLPGANPERNTRAVC